MKKLEDYKQTIFLFICYIVAIAGIAMQIYYSFSLDIWTDEGFSLKMVKHSYSEMVNLTASDVHPPLYYFILKFFMDLFGNCISPIYIGKLVSVVPFILLFVISATKIRKQWGNYVSGLFSVCMIGMSHLIRYGVEIRMYSWGMLFITMAFLFSYDIMKRGIKRDWIFFVLFSLMASYTHYFACIAAGFPYVILFVYFCIKDRKKIKFCIFATVVTIIGYLPWLSILLQQMKKVSDNYWIYEITKSTLIKYERFIFQDNILLVIYILIYICYLKNSIKNKEFTADTIISVAGGFNAAGTIVVGIVVSILIRPLFIIRYAVPTMAILWLGFVIALDKQKNKIVKGAVTVVIFIYCMMNIVGFAANEYPLKDKADKTMSLVETFDEDTIILTSFSHVNYTIAALTESDCYIYCPGRENKVFQNVYGNIFWIYDYDAVRQWVNEGKKVYVMDKKEKGKNREEKQWKHRKSLKKQLIKEGFRLKKLDNYRVERKVAVYKIEMY